MWTVTITLLFLFVHFLKLFIHSKLAPVVHILSLYMYTVRATNASEPVSQYIYQWVTEPVIESVSKSDLVSYVNLSQWVSISISEWVSVSTSESLSLWSSLSKIHDNCKAPITGQERIN